MEWLITSIAVVAWWYTGYRSFVYWWTSEFDYKSDDRFPAAICALFGPLWWPIGAVFHNGGRPRRIITPKRTPPENGHE